MNICKIVPKGEIHGSLYSLPIVYRNYYFTLRLQTECGNYKMIAEEAYRQFVQIQGKDILSRSQDGRLRDWLDLMEEVNYFNYLVHYLDVR